MRFLQTIMETNLLCENAKNSLCKSALHHVMVLPYHQFEVFRKGVLMVTKNEFLKLALDIEALRHYGKQTKCTLHNKRLPTMANHEYHHFKLSRLLKTSKTCFFVIFGVKSLHVFHDLCLWIYEKMAYLIESREVGNLEILFLELYKSYIGRYRVSYSYKKH